MKIYPYKDINAYRKAQIEANLAKQDRVWVKKSDIEWIKKQRPNAKRILCHGTRNGAEQKYFLEEYPNANVIGTEISPRAREYPNTIRHDFNKPHPKLKNFDIVFSNSLDHSNNPLETLKVWRDQLAENGSLFVEVLISKENNFSSEWDPLEWDSPEEFLELIDTLDLKPVAAVLAQYQKDVLIYKMYQLKRK